MGDSKLVDVARAMWTQYLEAAFPPDAEPVEDGYGSAEYIATCRKSFSLIEKGEANASDIDNVAMLLEGCEEDPVKAFKEAFDTSVEEVVVAEVGDDEQINGAVVAARRDGFVFGWVTLQD